MPGASGDIVAAVRPLQQFVVKVHARCDLACDYCYVYTHADKSWLRKPRRMSAATVHAVARRIREHATTHDLNHVDVVLHGGEPLLLGGDGLAETATILRDALEPVTNVSLRLQTNGVLLTAEICEVLADRDVKVGVSLDGGRLANDRHRLFPSGASSFDSVRRALALLREPAYRAIYGGILCTIDVRNDPIVVYRDLLREEPPRVDFLLPHATWDVPPFRPPSSEAQIDPVYADWLFSIFDRWLDDDRPVPIRLFDALLSLQEGRAGGTEALGLDPVDLAVVETDGTWEQVDSLKIAYAGAPETGLNVVEHSIDELARHKGIDARRTGLAGLSVTCQKCDVVDRCGGGLYSHRFGRGKRFDNPSVFCPDLYRLIALVDERRPAPEQAAAITVAAHVAASDDAAPDAAPRSVLRQLASGSATPAVLDQLVEEQHSFNRVLVRSVAMRLGPGPSRDGWELLVELDRQAPAAVRRVLTHPYVRAWARRCLIGGSRVPVAAHADHLAAIAVAAAMHAGVQAVTEAPIRGGRLHLPTIGALVLADGGDGWATVSVSEDVVTVRAEGAAVTVPRGPGEVTAPGWHPVRSLRVDDWRAALDDVDRYRDCFRTPVTPGLDAPAADRCVDHLRQAWGHVREDPRLATGVSRLVRTITPLRRARSARPLPATPGRVFGAVGVPVGHAPLAVAVAMAQEVGRMVFSAAHDTWELVGAEPAVSLEVPWRGGAQPLLVALGDAFGRAAAVEWELRSGHAGIGAGRGAVDRERDSLLRVASSAQRTGALTWLGHQFVTDLETRIGRWPVPDSA